MKWRWWWSSSMLALLLIFLSCACCSECMTVFVGRCDRHTRPLSWAAEEAGCISSACTLRVQPARCVACIYQPVSTVCITCTLCRLGWPTFADSCCFTRSTLVPWNCPHFCWPSGDRRRYTECPLFQNYTVVIVGAIDCRVMDWNLWIVILWNSRLESWGYCTTKLFSVYYLFHGHFYMMTTVSKNVPLHFCL